MSRYDYIFTGAGCAGLSLLVRILSQPELAQKKILVIDQSPKNQNDRTWCFWEKGAGFFEPVVYRSWQRLGVYGRDYSGEQDIAPYHYKMIRGIDFYGYCTSLINKHPSVTWLKAQVNATGHDPDGNESGQAYAETSAGTFYAQYVFNSIIRMPESPAKGTHHLLQHFKGFLIRTAEPVFDPGFATLMDFRISQKLGTSFVYSLPLSSTEALVEYTLFTPSVLSQDEYDRVLHQYISTVQGIAGYEITDEEFGVIPMTTYRFSRNNGNVINIGTAGGQTKASSGYTFRFIQKQSDAITEQLLARQFPVGPRTTKQKKFDWYDATLLNILSNRVLPGARVFTQLFRRNNFNDVFAFLDNETTLMQDLRIIRVLPVLPFTRAALAEWRRAFR